MSVILLAPLILLLISLAVATIFVIYSLLYKRRINRSLNENNPKHSALPDMRTALSATIIVILLVNIFSLNAQIDNLNDEIVDLNNKMDRNMYLLNQNVNDANSKLDEFINDNKLISSFNFNVKDTNPDDIMAEIDFELSLKTFSENTEVSIVINNNVAKLTKNTAGKYTGNFSMNMFEEINNVSALITEDNTTTRENIYNIDLECLWKYVLPSMDVICNPDYEYEKDTIHLQFVDGGYIYMNTTDNYFTDAYVEILIDNVSVKKISINPSKNISDYTVNLDESFKTEPDSTVEIYVIATDNLGYTHKTLTFSCDESSQTALFDYEEIFDNTGKKVGGRNIY